MHAFSRTFFLASIALLCAALPLHGEEPKQDKQHWYRLEVQTGDSTYQCIGSSARDEKEFLIQFKEEAFIVIDDAAYIDGNGRIKSWQDWDPKASSRLYLNPAFVILVNPLKGDPRKPVPRK